MLAFLSCKHYFSHMNKLVCGKRAQILRCLCEGNSMRATARLVDCSLNTVSKLLIEAGRACTKFQDKALRNLPSKRLQIDEVWGFVGAKDLNCSPEKKAQGWGSAWVWTALCADSKLLATWFIGPRVPNSAYHLLYDLRERLAAGNNVQVTTDGFAMYLKPIHSAFVGEANYAQLQKIYGAEPSSKGRYSPAQCMGTRRAIISRQPRPKAHQYVIYRAPTRYVTHEQSSLHTFDK